MLGTALETLHSLFKYGKSSPGQESRSQKHQCKWGTGTRHSLSRAHSEHSRKGRARGVARATDTRSKRHSSCEQGDALNFPLIRSRFSHWELVQSWDPGGPVYPLTLSFPNLSCSPTLGLQRLKRCERTACFLKRICLGLSSTVSSPSTFTGLVGSPGMSAAPQMISSDLSFRESWVLQICFSCISLRP